MAAIATLKALLGLDTGQYRTGLRASETATQKFQKTLAGIGRALGIAFTVGTVVAFAKRFASWASDVSIAARNVGLLTSEMLALNRVALQSGVELQRVQDMVGRLQTEFYEVAKGNETAAEKFRALNIDLRAFAALSPAEQLREIARAGMASGMPLEKLGDIFGRRMGPQAMVMLRAIAEDGLPAVAEAAGVAADRIEAAGSATARWWDQFKGFLLTQLVAKPLEKMGVLDMQGQVDQRKAIEEQRQRELQQLIEDAERRRNETMAEANDRMLREQLQGLEKLKAEYDATEREITKLIEDEMARQNERGAELLRERLSIARQAYWGDVAEFRAAQEQKRRDAIAAVEERFAQGMEALQQQRNAPGSRSFGASISADSVAQRGGIVGRTLEISTAVRQIELQNQAVQIAREELALQQRRDQDLAAIRDAVTEGTL